MLEHCEDARNEVMKKGKRVLKLTAGSSPNHAIDPACQPIIDVSQQGGLAGKPLSYRSVTAALG